jgi:hypothetical protein
MGRALLREGAGLSAETELACFDGRPGFMLPALGRLRAVPVECLLKSR